MRMFGLQIAGQKEMAVGLFVQLVGAEKRFELEMVAQMQLLAVELHEMVIGFEWQHDLHLLNETAMLAAKQPEMVMEAQRHLVFEFSHEKAKLATGIQWLNELVMVAQFQLFVVPEAETEQAILRLSLQVEMGDVEQERWLPAAQELELFQLEDEQVGVQQQDEQW